MREGFCALQARGLSFYVVLAACAAGGVEMEFCGCRYEEKKGKGLSFERWRLYPAGTEAFIFFNLGRLRGGRQMGAC